jgi:hypothetical protein
MAFDIMTLHLNSSLPKLFDELIVVVNDLYYQHITIVNEDSVGDAPNCGITYERNDTQ